jgi:hypothetical protein
MQRLASRIAMGQSRAQHVFRKMQSICLHDASAPLRDLRSPRIYRLRRLIACPRALCRMPRRRSCRLVFSLETAGAHQLLAVVTNSYGGLSQHPSRTLKPARETCEQFSLAREILRRKLLQLSRCRYDEKNTPEQVTLILKTGREPKPWCKRRRPRPAVCNISFAHEAIAAYHNRPE